MYSVKSKSLKHFHQNTQHYNQCTGKSHIIV